MFLMQGDNLGKNARILVIDDDRLIRDCLAMCLEQEGYVVDVAENGQEAIAKSFANFYNLAIVDWKLPDFEGTELLGKLKKTTPRMIKIMLTGYPSMDNAINAVNKRADAFHLKPLAMPKLLATIEALLKMQEEESSYSQTKVAEFIETRTKQILQNQNKPL